MVINSGMRIKSSVSRCFRCLRHAISTANILWLSIDWLSWLMLVYICSLAIGEKIDKVKFKIVMLFCPLQMWKNNSRQSTVGFFALGWKSASRAPLFFIVIVGLEFSRSKCNQIRLYIYRKPKTLFERTSNQVGLIWIERKKSRV